MLSVTLDETQKYVFKLKSGSSSRNTSNKVPRMMITPARRGQYLD